MSDAPWQGDACSLVEAFRGGERSPAEEIEASVAAVQASGSNAFTFLDVERAREAASQADLSLPFGGVPVGIKELDPVEGWPYTMGSLVFKDGVAEHTATSVSRLVGRGGAVPVGQTFSSEFGGLNVSINRLNGVCRNPWDAARSPGGSSGGSAAAVAGGLVTIATGGDGGGSIRIPAGFTGLVGMKGTAGRIPRGPRADIAPLTVVLGCLARSVRDVARWFDVCAGYHPRDPYSLPTVDGWEGDLGGHDLRGMRATVVPAIGGAVVRQEVQEIVVEAGEELAERAGLTVVGADVRLPGFGIEWALSNLVQLRRYLDHRWPACRDDLTPEIAFAMDVANEYFSLSAAAKVEDQRTAMNEAMADVFEQVDFLITATNPDVPFPAETTVSTRVGDQAVGPENNGLLTIPANITGNPAISIPAGTFDGLPVGLQVVALHHRDALLLDLASIAERERPWPLVAPGAPV